MTVIQTKPTLLDAMLQSPAVESRVAQIVWTISRVAVGLLMIHNGFSKLADVQGFANGVVSFIGLPYPVFLTYCAAYAEIGSSILLVLGLLTRLNALILLFTMFIALFFHLKKDGWHIPPLETASLYALWFSFFLTNGGGLFSLDTAIARWLRKS
ncbi:DoxX family protein [Leptolyngbya sp. FACHB-711]|uniref:DoxX family protein n=1 Tax=unclassified Leptolyngbya TaxID=2650499 RepID=UPI00168816B9|nr:DoxX family protein [Leptolyngbya sp. FACHB-711]MBD1849283.1 DoxX family protein [Cyanobacteria bacterium FACHB-502]MBD2026835.1 DoxX family protein [Leptolyngbya sp. FACHB-711]